MKYLYRKVLLIVCSILVLSACDTSILNKSPLDQLSDASVWQDENLVKLFVNDIYLGLQHGLREVSNSSLTDDTHFIHGYGTNEIVLGITNPGARGAWNRGDLNHYDWGDLYYRIRQTNVALDNLAEADIAEGFRTQMEGEVRFLRAYFYHQLLRTYGGVPLITQTFELDDELLVPRNTFQEVVDFVVQEADAAAGLLPPQADELGRATWGAAKALKARILLHAASDLYANPQGSNPELTGYPGGGQQGRWQAASDAAWEIIQSGMYSLKEDSYAPWNDLTYDGNPNQAETGNFNSIFLTNDDHQESIFARYFLPDSRGGGDPGRYNGPNGYRNWAGNTPTQSIVDAFEMADGSAFDWDNPAHAAAPYDNRDPRFYASIQFDGHKWQASPSFRAPIEPHGKIQTWATVMVGGTEHVGVDTRQGPIEDWNGSYTRYYMRKFIDPANPHHQSRQHAVPWRYFRYAEILFAYAEAQMELGNEAVARQYINEVRDRAGMPDITESGQALVDRYHKERRIELFYEEHRYFDIRRWMTAPTKYHDALGIEITANATDQNDRSTFTNVNYDQILVQERGWNDNQYFVPIRDDEMQRNNLLIQNPGY